MSSGRPLVVGVADLLRRPGARREVHVVALLAVEMSAARTRAGADIVVSLAVEALDDQRVVATGQIRFCWEGDCRRCLEPVLGTAALDVREVFEAEPRDDDSYPLDGDRVHLEAMVRDAVLSGLPLAPVCDDDCRGPDPDRFPTGIGTESEDVARDPRWAALDALRFEDE